MIIRKIQPDELKRTIELFGISFEISVDNTKSAQQLYDNIKNNPTSREDYYCLERWAAFEDDNKTMMSYFITKPFSIHFDGNFCNMMGIGGVATLPHFRRNGGIRGCFQMALPDMYHSGVSFSYLYPFSTSYYRKFGYEMCCERFEYQIFLNKLPSFPVEGACYLVEKDNTYMNDIKEIYTNWQTQYNLMVVNEQLEYETILNTNPAKDQKYTYVYKSKDMTPKGFMCYTIDITADKVRTIVCDRFVFTDCEGFYGLMNLAKNFASDHNAIIFDSPLDIPITSLLPEWSMKAGFCRKKFEGMVRVINVEKVLNMARYQGNGTLSIQIIDTLIEENHHCFKVAFHDGKAQKIELTEESCDISMNIGDFSRLIVGMNDASDLKYMNSVKVYAPIEQIQKVFYKKPNLLLEYF